MTSAEAMESQEKMKKAMEHMVNEIDRNNLRRIQYEMHKCAMKCCENDKSSLEATHSCVEICSQKVQVAQNYVHQEIGNFQERLQRCVLECQDSAKDKLGSNPTDDEMDRAKGQFEGCAIRCVDQNLALIPSLLKRIKGTLDSHPQLK